MLGKACAQEQGQPKAQVRRGARVQSHCSCWHWAAARYKDAVQYQRQRADVIEHGPTAEQGYSSARGSVKLTDTRT